MSYLSNFSYDIVIWSATGMKWIEVKMRELGVTGNPNYSISFMLESKAMISVFTEQYGVVGIVSKTLCNTTSFLTFYITLDVLFRKKAYLVYIINFICWLTIVVNE